MIKRCARDFIKTMWFLKAIPTSVTLLTGNEFNPKHVL